MKMISMNENLFEVWRRGNEFQQLGESLTRCTRLQNLRLCCQGISFPRLLPCFSFVFLTRAE